MFPFENEICGARCVMFVLRLGWTSYFKRGFHIIKEVLLQSLSVTQNQSTESHKSEFIAVVTK